MPWPERGLQEGVPGVEFQEPQEEFQEKRSEGEFEEKGSRSSRRAVPDRVQGVLGVLGLSPTIQLRFTLAFTLQCCLVGWQGV